MTLFNFIQQSDLQPIKVSSRKMQTIKRIFQISLTMILSSDIIDCVNGYYGDVCVPH